MEMCRTKIKQGGEITGKDKEKGMFLGVAGDKMRQPS